MMFAVQFFVNSFSYRLFAEANYNNSGFCSHSTFKACFTLTVTMIPNHSVDYVSSYTFTQFSSIHKEFREFIQIEVVPGAPQQSQVFRCGRCCAGPSLNKHGSLLLVLRSQNKHLVKRAARASSRPQIKVILRHCL